MRNIQYMGWLLGSCILLAGCVEKTIYTVDDNTPYVSQKVALVVAKTPTTIEAALLNAATHQVEERLREYPEFSQFLTAAQTEQRLAQKGAMKFLLVQYAQTFALTGISDKNISAPIGRTLLIDHFFIIHAERFVCVTCASGEQFLMKFYLIDTQTSKLIWRGRVQRNLDVTEEADAIFESVVLQAAKSILEGFVETFKVPWHRQRYENLKKLRSPEAVIEPS